MKWLHSIKSPRGTIQRRGGGDGVFRLSVRGWLASLILTVALITLMQGCGAFNPGKFKWIEKTAKGEEFYLVKDMFMTPGSAHIRKQSFDHAMNETINLVFIPSNEKNTYVAESIWYDPSDVEFKTIRTTFDKEKENKAGFERDKAGTTRIHTMPTKELHDHKPGLWKVALYLEGRLVRTMTFTVM